MTSPLAQYWSRTAKIVRDNAVKAMQMDAAHGPSTAPRTLFRIHSPPDLKQFATGCDADIGGLSTCTLDLDSEGRGRFRGEMRLGVRPEFEGKLARGGYAGFRTKTRPTLFGEMTDDLSYHKYLALRVRGAGDPATRNSYFVNIQTDGPIKTDLWQHRLFLRGHGGWEDVLIPLSAFVLTNTGEPVKERVGMMQSGIRTVGISLLGGKSNVEGAYELGVDHVWATNEENGPPPTD